MTRTLQLCLSLVVAAMMGPAIRAQEESGVPPEVQQELRYLAGTWKYEVTTGGETTRGEGTNRFAPGRYCLFGSLVPESGDTQFSYILGWDKQTGWLTERGCSPDGGGYTLHWKRESPTVSLGEGSGHDGKQSWTGSYKLVKDGPNRFTVTGTYKVGEEEFDWDITFTKVPAAKGKKAKQ